MLLPLLSFEIWIFHNGQSDRNLLCYSLIILLYIYTNYYAFIEPVTCNICGDLDVLIPCASREVASNVTTTKCPSDKRFCMTDLHQDAKGNNDIFKR